MSYLRFALFVVGIMVSIGASAKLSPLALERLSDPASIREDEPPGSWPDTMPWFFLGIGMAAAGVVLWRNELRQERRARVADTARHPSTPAPPAADTNPLGPVLEGIAPLEQLVQESGDLRGWELMRRVDLLLETHVLPTVEQRQEVMNRHGASAGAEILIALAFGERMLNRCWSAAADGHLPEARSCLPEALEGFHEVRRLAG